MPPEKISPVDAPVVTEYVTIGILGGIIVPRKPATEHVVTAKRLSYPASIMEGTKIEPIAITVAVAEPEIAPMNAEATNATIASPPGRPPTMEFAKLTRRLDTPPSAIRPPAIMKNGSAIREKESIETNKRWGMTAIAVVVKKYRGIADAASNATAIGTPKKARTKKTINNVAAITASPPQTHLYPL